MLDAETIRNVTIENRVMKIRERGSREGWFTSTGVHVVNLDGMVNFRVFLLLLEELFGVHVRAIKWW